MSVHSFAIIPQARPPRKVLARVVIPNTRTRPRGQMTGRVSMQVTVQITHTPGTPLLRGSALHLRFRDFETSRAAQYFPKAWPDSPLQKRAQKLELCGVRIPNRHPIGGARNGERTNKSPHPYASPQSGRVHFGRSLGLRTRSLAAIVMALHKSPSRSPKPMPAPSEILELVDPSSAMRKPNACPPTTRRRCGAITDGANQTHNPDQSYFRTVGCC